MISPELDKKFEIDVQFNKIDPSAFWARSLLGGKLAYGWQWTGGHTQRFAIRVTARPSSGFLGLDSDSLLTKTLHQELLLMECEQIN